MLNLWWALELHPHSTWPHAPRQFVQEFLCCWVMLSLLFQFLCITLYQKQDFAVVRLSHMQRWKEFSILETFLQPASYWVMASCCTWTQILFFPKLNNKNTHSTNNQRHNSHTCCHTKQAGQRENNTPINNTLYYTRSSTIWYKKHVIIVLRLKHNTYQDVGGI